MVKRAVFALLCACTPPLPTVVPTDETPPEQMLPGDTGPAATGPEGTGATGPGETGPAAMPPNCAIDCGGPCAPCTLSSDCAAGTD